LTPTAHLLLSSFFSPHTPPPQFYTLSLHDALPISSQPQTHGAVVGQSRRRGPRRVVGEGALQKEVEQPQVLLQGGAVRVGGVLEDRKSTRLNSSHVSISYAVFCLKKKKKNTHSK